MAEDKSNQYLHPRSASDYEIAPDGESNHGISNKLPPGGHDTRPPPVKLVSAPAYQSPIRHHKRTPSRSKGVKETLDARSHYGSSDDDGASVHRINQYIIKQEIGRGSFGAVHLAVDQFGHEFAVKEFSKSRLRKRAQSNLLRKPNQARRPGQLAAGVGFNSPMHRISSDKSGSMDANNSLSLIKEEIAIMKKLNHNNLVSLIEVLDDPQEDSLYMVLEMCKKGVAMKVGLGERAEPYDDETCRCWFRDMILGIEYLHAQGIIHRDIKPDNCLITDDDVLKIVDFGVSEMFEKQSEMATAKSAGSPAFMPPELCVARHGQVSGRAADIWSMGVTLYCLRYGHIPFEKNSMLQLYDSIRDDSVPLDEENDPNFADLIQRVLEKDPEKRITLEELRNHPWVTKNGTDPLLSAEENYADLLEPPTEAEMDNAITGNMAHLLAVMKAVKRFKKIGSNKRGELMGGLFGRDSRLVAPPHSMRQQTRSQDTFDRRPMNKVLVTEGVHQDIEVDDNLHPVPAEMEQLKLYQSPEIQEDNEFGKPFGESAAHYKQRLETEKHKPDSSAVPPEHRKTEQRSRTFPFDGYAKGHAHDPLEDTTFLKIGHDPSTARTDEDVDAPIVSESPSAVDLNIYEQAYQEEMQRILDRRGREPSIYMTRRVEHRDDIRGLSAIKDAGKYAARSAAAKWGDLSSRAYGARGSGAYPRPSARAAYGKFTDRWLSTSTAASASASTEASADANDSTKTNAEAGAAAAAAASSSNDTAEESKEATKSRREYAREYFEPWKQSAWSAASTGLGSSKTAAKSAQTRLGALYSKGSSSAGEGLSSFVARAQAKGWGGSSDQTSKDNEQVVATEATDSPQPIDNQNQSVESATQPQDAPQTPPPNDTNDKEPETPSAPGAFPVTPVKSSAFKEDIT